MNLFCPKTGQQTKFTRKVMTTSLRNITEDDFWRLVRVTTPYGKYHAAHITCKGYDYSEESRLDEGENVAKEKLFNKLKSLGHIQASGDTAKQGEKAHTWLTEKGYVDSHQFAKGSSVPLSKLLQDYSEEENARLRKLVENAIIEIETEDGLGLDRIVLKLREGIDYWKKYNQKKKL